MAVRDALRRHQVPEQSILAWSFLFFVSTKEQEVDGPPENDVRRPCCFASIALFFHQTGPKDPLRCFVGHPRVGFIGYLRWPAARGTLCGRDPLRILLCALQHRSQAARTGQLPNQWTITEGGKSLYCSY